MKEHVAALAADVAASDHEAARAARAVVSLPPLSVHDELNHAKLKVALKVALDRRQAKHAHTQSVDMNVLRIFRRLGGFWLGPGS